MIEIKKVAENKKEHLDILLLADPREAMIDKYLEKGEMFALFENGKLASVAVIIRLNSISIELKNLATVEIREKQGFATQLLDYIFDYYGSDYSEIFVGTAESGVAFYKRFGFLYSHKVANFFTDNYPEPMYEDGILCKDMIYLKKTLVKHAEAGVDLK